MKHSIAAITAALSLAAWVGGCAGGAAFPDHPPGGLSAGQALYVAETAFAAASAGLEQASAADVLDAPTAARARQVYEQAYRALEQAREAKAAGDEARAVARASDAIAASAQLGGFERTAVSAKEAQP